jgi:hypothetical protein
MVEPNLSMVRPSVVEPSLGLTSTSALSVSSILTGVEAQWQGVPLWQRLRDSLPWWEMHAPPFVVGLIRQGVGSDKTLPNFLSQRRQQKADQEISLANQMMLEYKESGAVREVTDPENTRHLVPWFVLTKMEVSGVKHRLIADCRELNQFCSPQKFTLETMQTIYPLLKKGWFCAKLDLKDAYFHLPVQKSFQKYLRMQVGKTQWEFLGAPFGLNTLPKLFMAVMKPLQKVWRSRGFMVFVYLDDIIVFGSTKTSVEKHLKCMVQDLCSAGFKISTKKSVLEPVQVVQHLGFILNLAEGKLEVPPSKLKIIRKELGKVLMAKSLTCRKMSSILGQIRSYLVALPFLRLVTQRLLKFSQSHHTNGWDFSVQIPQDLKEEIRSLKKNLEPGLGRPFAQAPSRFLASDSSTWAWGGVETTQKSFIQDFWRHDHVLHINEKELRAAVSTIQSFAKPGETIRLNVDNQVALSYLKKWGGRKNYLNKILEPLFQWCWEKQVQLDVQWVPQPVWLQIL